MKRKINCKENSLKKELTIFVVFFLLSFFIISVFILADRNYFLFEKTFKNISGKISHIIVNKIYSNNKLNENIISSKESYLKDENNKLRKMVSLKEKNELYEVCEVINHSSKLFYNTVEISKGYNYNIEKENPVINSEGLIGFIGKTSKNISEVKLLTSINENNMLSVLINSNDNFTAGILSKYDKKQKLFLVTNVSSNSNVKVGDKVVLSGYNNELYKGIYIGDIKKIEDANYGLDKNVYVKSNVNFDDLLFVAVLTREK